MAADLVSGFLKGAQAIGKAVGEAGAAVADGVAGSLEELARDTGKELKEVGDKLANGDLLGAALEWSDVASPGGQLTRALDALGFLPDDPVAQNIFSAGVNFASGGLPGIVAGMKDLHDVGSAARSVGSGPRSRTRSRPDIAQSHSVRHPRDVFRDAEAALQRGVTRPARGFLTPEVHVHVHVHHHGIIRPGCGFGAWNRWINLNPPIMKPPWISFRDTISDLIERGMRDAGVSREGPSCRDKPLGERTISDIVNDKSLTFEDMVAMVMFKITNDMQEQVEDQIRKMEGMTSQRGASGAGGASGAENAQGGSSKGQGGRRGDGAQKGSGMDDLLWKGLDFIVLGPVASLVGQGLTGGGSITKKALGVLGDNPQLLNGMIDGAKALTPILAPLVSTAIAAIPGAGPVIAPFVPMLLPVVMEGLGSAMKHAAGAASDGGPVGSPNPAAGNPNAGGAYAMSGAAGSQGANASGQREGNGKASQDSINIEMEKLKLLMQRMQQMQQALSNVLNTMHQGAMNSIRNIK